VPGPCAHKGWSGQIIERELGGAMAPVAARTSRRWALNSRLCRWTTPGPRESTAVCQIDPIGSPANPGNELSAPKTHQVLWVGLEVSSDADSVAIAKCGGQVVEPSPDEQALLRADFELFVRSYFRRGAPPLPVTKESLAGAPQGSQRRRPTPSLWPCRQPTQIGKCASICVRFVRASCAQMTLAGRR